MTTRSLPEIRGGLRSAGQSGSEDFNFAEARTKPRSPSQGLRLGSPDLRVALSPFLVANRAFPKACSAIFVHVDFFWRIFGAIPLHRAKPEYDFEAGRMTSQLNKLSVIVYL